MGAAAGVLVLRPQLGVRGVVMTASEALTGVGLLLFLADFGLPLVGVDSLFEDAALVCAVAALLLWKLER